MPDEFHRLMQDVSDRIKGVVVAIGSGKDDDSKFHCAVTPPAIFREHLSLTQGRAVWLWAMGSQTDHGPPRRGSCHNGWCSQPLFPPRLARPRFAARR